MESLGDGRALDSAQGVYGTNSVYTTSLLMIFANFIISQNEYLAGAQYLILLTVRRTLS
jgi:hypothetical protein